MTESVKRFWIGFLAMVVIGLVAMIALASGYGAGAQTPAQTQTLQKTPVTSKASTVVPSPTPPPSEGASLQPATATPSAVLVGAGDIASCASSGDEATASLLETIDATVFTLGDNVYDNGTATEFANCYGPSWGRAAIKSRTKPVPGNHDYNTAGATGYFGYFGAAAGDPAKGYYAYDQGSWRVYMLNSNCSIVSCSAGSAQEQWLRTDLAANPRSCVAAMWHHPRFSSGSEHGSSTATQALWQALDDFNADLVLTGHDHVYERFAPQTATGALDNDRGIVELVVGTGGRSHYSFGTVRANSLVRNSDTYGVVRLALSASSYTFDFIPVAGQTFTDSGTVACH